MYRDTSLSQIAKGGGSVHTPITIETADGLYLSIHEAALIDYSSMTLQALGDLVFKANLVPWSDGILVKGSTPLKTPWRTIQIAEKPGDLITSYLILNLNEPNALGDVSWVKPGKYIGIWWGMHLGKWTWGSGPNHVATTENTRQYIDFAAQNGFSGVLVEGWNLGWDGDWASHGDQFNFTTPFPDYDLFGLAEYAKSRGVVLIAHNETAAAVANHPEKTKVVYCKDDKRRDNYPNEKFDFLGFTFRPRLTKFREGKYGVNFSPAVSEEAAKTMRHTIRSWRFHRRSDKNLSDLSHMYNPVLGGWINYNGSYYRSGLYPICDQLNCALKQWATRKFKTLRGRKKRAAHWLGRIARRDPRLFVHWQLGWRPTAGR